MSDPAHATVSIASGNLAVVIGGAALSVAVSLPSGPAPATVTFPTPATPQVAVGMPAPSGPVAVAIALAPGLPGTPGTPGTGLAWVSLTVAEYDALTPKRTDTIYDLTDAPWSA